MPCSYVRDRFFVAALKSDKVRKFDDFEKGFEVMKSGLCGKVLLELE